MPAGVVSPEAPVLGLQTATTLLPLSARGCPVCTSTPGISLHVQISSSPGKVQIRVHPNDLGLT